MKWFVCLLSILALCVFVVNLDAGPQLVRKGNCSSGQCSAVGGAQCANGQCSLQNSQTAASTRNGVCGLSQQAARTGITSGGLPVRQGGGQVGGCNSGQCGSSGCNSGGGGSGRRTVRKR